MLLSYGFHQLLLVLLLRLSSRAQAAARPSAGLPQEDRNAWYNLFIVWSTKGKTCQIAMRQMRTRTKRGHAGHKIAAERKKLLLTCTRIASNTGSVETGTDCSYPSVKRQRAPNLTRDVPLVFNSDSEGEVAVKLLMCHLFGDL